MQFLVLGPLKVVLDGSQEIVFRAAKQRSLLALLLINANNSVPVERLIGEIWETSPPTANNLVRQYVSKLRKVLGYGEPHDVRVQTHSSGYALLADRGCSDASQFERLVRTAREHVREDPLAARETIRTALQLWRGPAFADVPFGPSVSAERQRLDELRISAQELSVQISLAEGQVDNAISQLRALVVHHPLREPLYAELMRALSRRGRKGDALEVYRTAREVLVAELGLEPGEELRSLERAILADEVPVDAPRPAARRESVALSEAAGTTVPAPLPAELADFVGRHEQTAMIEQALCAPEAEGPRIVVLSGLPGVGKTVLAVRAGHRLKNMFPDGRLFLRLRAAGSAVEPMAALGRAIELLGVASADQPASLLARQDLYRGLLLGKRVLLVIDDAVTEQQIRWLIPGGNGSALLVTSRLPLAALEGARHISLPAFDVAESMRLLATVAGGDRVDAEPEAARAITDSCGGLPLAIRVAAARAGLRPHRPLGQVARRLVGENLFDELSVGDVSLRELLAATYQQLGPEDRRLIGLLRVRDLDSGALVAEPDLPASEAVVDHLVEIGVLEVAGRDAAGQVLFRCAELVRRYVQSQMDSPASPEEPDYITNTPARAPAVHTELKPLYRTIPGSEGGSQDVSRDAQVEDSPRDGYPGGPALRRIHHDQRRPDGRGRAAAR